VSPAFDGRRGAVLRKYLVLLALLLALGISSVCLMGAARVVQVPCGRDLDAIVNADSGTTATLFQLGACNYNVDHTVILRAGDGLAGPVGTFTQRGPAFDPDPVAEITGINGIPEVIRPQGSSPPTVTLRWISVTGAKGQYQNGKPMHGTGGGLAMASASNTSTVYAVRSHHNEASGVTNAHGIYDRVELDHNATNPDFLGFTGSGLKAIVEVEIKGSYVHDNAGNGLWCDVGCSNVSGMANGFWVHENLVVNNGRSGVRFENSPTQALIENNHIHGNSYDGVSVRDSQNALVRNNTLGAATIAGVSYAKNAANVAVVASDSGGADRTDLRNVDIVNNILNGEIIKGCELSDSIGACSGNK
jgi:parallel beta-helix repeat protein